MLHIGSSLRYRLQLILSGNTFQSSSNVVPFFLFKLFVPHFSLFFFSIWFSCIYIASVTAIVSLCFSSLLRLTPGQACGWFSFLWGNRQLSPKKNLYVDKFPVIMKNKNKEAHMSECWNNLISLGIIYYDHLKFINIRILLLLYFNYNVDKSPALNKKE